MDVNPSDAALFINGMYFDMDFTDIYTLLDHIRTEDRVMGGLYKLGKFTLCCFCSLFFCLILIIHIFFSLHSVFSLLFNGSSFALYIYSMFILAIVVSLTFH